MDQKGGENLTTDKHRSRKSHKKTGLVKLGKNINNPSLNPDRKKRSLQYFMVDLGRLSQNAFCWRAKSFARSRAVVGGRCYASV